MKTADFHYELPPELIAQHPAPERSDSRMLVVHRDAGRIEHAQIRALPDYLRANDLLVVNDTRVIPARVYGRKRTTGGAVEVLFLEECAPGEWEALVRASRPASPGTEFELADGAVVARVLRAGYGGKVRLGVTAPGGLMAALEARGVMPLPPYIHRTADDTDRERYQTVYARHPGAVAAPTAGLHFTPELFAALAARGVQRTAVTLHVGWGTFRPVKAAIVEEHAMESERYEIKAEAAAAIRRAKDAGGRIVAVGSTTVRTLESAAATSGDLPAPGSGRSSLFIHPPYRFRAVDAMLTNFHLPASTLIMMVCAFGGHELIMRAYREAVAARYRFYSYGDCMLIV